jgi:hypothetical protein
MMSASVDWATIASLATAAGTLVLGIATFAAVRSSNRSARIAEAALQEQRRPLLAPSRLEDPKQKIMFMEGNWVSASGGHGVAQHIDGIVYFAISLRNVGSGIAVCQGWTAKPLVQLSPEVLTGTPLEDVQEQLLSHTSPDDIHLQSRDLYVPAGDIGMWQGALRNPVDPDRADIIDAIDNGRPIMVELLYSDQIGLQRTISRFSLVPAGDSWIASLTRHWYLDWDGPRPEDLALSATEAVLRDQEAAIRRRRTAEGTDSDEDGKGSTRAGGGDTDAQ